mmetsp:Transcript_5819/g.9181  ORF Transcript_5819/g.9181 Transcript_5819/m.9181 type:complete len:124 (-) Transcript_5819:136-507(-)
MEPIGMLVVISSDCNTSEEYDEVTTSETSQNLSKEVRLRRLLKRSREYSHQPLDQNQSSSINDINNDGKLTMTSSHARFPEETLLNLDELATTLMPPKIVKSEMKVSLISIDTFDEIVIAHEV